MHDPTPEILDKSGIRWSKISKHIARDMIADGRDDIAKLLARKAAREFEFEMRDAICTELMRRSAR